MSFENDNLEPFKFEIQVEKIAGSFMSFYAIPATWVFPQS
jgi:hypothetical protein